jgi:hypothetical protein
VASDDELDAKDVALQNSTDAVAMLVIALKSGDSTIAEKIRAAMGILEVAGFIQPGVYDDA